MTANMNCCNVNVYFVLVFRSNVVICTKFALILYKRGNAK
jgi:hypothetical protein